MWKLFPVRNKVPVLPGDWRGHSTTDPAQIEAWRDLGYDLAVDCGASGLFVIDADGAEGLATAAALDLPPTYTMQTPRGGKHFYYVGDGPNSVQGLGPKLDTRGAGGYVVWEAAGYELVDDPPVASIAERLLAILNQRKDRKASASDSLDTKDQVKQALAYLSIRKPAIEGEGGNEWTYKTAAAIRDLGIGEDNALEVLDDWNERCLPPWDTEELAQIVANAWRYAQNEEGAQARTFDPATRFAGVAYEAPPAEEKPSRFRMWSIAEAQARPKPSFLFDGILPARMFGIAFAPPESGKTWLLLDMMLRIALGWNLAGEQVSKPRDVIWFAGEGFEDLVHSRIAAWCDWHGVEIPSRFHLFENFPDVGDEDQMDELVAEVVKRATDVAAFVVDTYARAMAEGGLSENDPLDVMKFVRQMEGLKRGFGCTVLAIHHSGKDMSLGARGSNSLIAAADFAFSIHANWDMKALKLECAKMKAAKRFEPLHYEAIEHHESLVVRGITASAYNALTRVEDVFSSRNVGAALAKVGAHDPAHAVTVHVLATAMYTAEIGEPETEVQAKLDRIVKKLNALGRGRLEQYVSAAGWSFPE